MGQRRRRSPARSRRCCDSATLAVGTEEELAAASGTADVAGGAATLLESGIQALVLKRGARGSTVFRAGRAAGRRRAVSDRGPERARRRRRVRERLPLRLPAGLAARARRPHGQRVRRHRRHAARLRQLHADARRGDAFVAAQGGRRYERTHDSPPDDGAGGGAVPGAAAHGARRPRAAALRRRVRHLRPRQRRRHRPGAARSSAARCRYYLARNEQAMVHTAAAYAKMHNRLRTLACTTLDRPGRDEHDHRRGGATINRVPVLLLPGDIFASRRPAPVLQQLESSQSQDVSVNDCFKPVSRYWDRINRPEQIVTALPEAMRVLTSPAETGAVTLALPQDVQAEAYDYPAALFEPRVWTIARAARRIALGCSEAAQLIRASRRPMIVAGGGVHLQRSDRRAAAVRRRDRHRRRRDAGGQRRAARPASAVARRRRRHRHAGGQPARARRRSRHRHRLAAQRFHDRVEDRVSARATSASSRSTSPSSTPFKHAALPLVGDARAVLEELLPLVAGYHVERGVHRSGRRIAGGVASRSRPRVQSQQQSAVASRNPQSPEPVAVRNPQSASAQAQVIGVLQETLGPDRRDRLRRRQPARRPAQAVARARSQGLSHGVRLLVHGLRDCRRARREDGGAGPRRLRPGRRRLVPDDGAGNRHGGAGGHQAHDRPARQPRLRQHRRPVRVGRQRRVRHALPLSQCGRPASSTATCCRSISRPMPRRSAHACIAPTRSTAFRDALARRASRHASRRSSSSRSIARRASAATNRGGTCRSPRCRRPARCRPRARRTRERAAAGARLSVIRVANAPCSWGVLEFEAPATHAPAAQVLDEMAAAGYAGTELGDWGFLPTEPAALAGGSRPARADARRRVRAGRARRARTRSTKASSARCARRRCSPAPPERGTTPSR